jgi:hypothetical protein
MLSHLVIWFKICVCSKAIGLVNRRRRGSNVLGFISARDGVHLHATAAFIPSTRWVESSVVGDAGGGWVDLRVSLDQVTK